MTDTLPRHDWTREDITALYEAPLDTLFAKALPQCCTAWIWDHIFCFGDLWIFKAALGLLKLLEPHLLVQDEMILGKRALGLS